MKKLLSATGVLFLLALLLELIPEKREGIIPLYYITVVAFLGLLYILIAVFSKNKEKVETVGDVTAIILGLLIVWELATAKFDLLDKLLFPAPSVVFELFVSEWKELLKGLVSSLELLFGGYVLALLVAIPLALFIGWRKRLYRAVKPLTKVLGPIPTIVYIPYTIALLPTFKASSIFVIFIGAFWPIFINTLNGVFNVEKKIVDSAKAINVNERAMLFNVILPAAMPSIISGATIGLVLSFILLTAAEMIGATSGLGWYVKYFSDFADYPRVIVGIIFIGIVVTGITFLFDKIEGYLLRWRR